MTRPRQRRPLGVPLGWAVGVAGSAVLVLGYVWWAYWSTPEYRAAQHYTRALRLLGPDDGRSCSGTALEQAFHHVLEAAQLAPGKTLLRDHLERLRQRFEERGFRLSEEGVRRAEAASKLTGRRPETSGTESNGGAGEPGWEPQRLVAGPRTVLTWAGAALAVVVGGWALLRVSRRALRERARARLLREGAKEAWRLSRQLDDMTVREKGQLNRSGEWLAVQPRDHEATAKGVKVEEATVLQGIPERSPVREAALARERRATGTERRAADDTTGGNPSSTARMDTTDK